MIDLMKALKGQHDALVAKQDAVSAPGLLEAIVAQDREIVHRINAVQNLLLVAETGELADAVAAVKAADGKLTGDLQNIADSAAFISSASGFLACVDKAIAVAAKAAAL